MGILMSRNPYCSQDETKRPFEADDRVSVGTSCVSNARENGTVKDARWNDEDSDTGWWVTVELDADLGPASLTDRPRVGRQIVVTAYSCRRLP